MEGGGGVTKLLIASTASSIYTALTIWHTMSGMELQVGLLHLVADRAIKQELLPLDTNKASTELTSRLQCMYSGTFELRTPKGLSETVLNSEVVSFLRSISM